MSRSDASPILATTGGSPLAGLGFLACAVLLYGTSYWPTEVAGPHVASTMLTALRTFPVAFLLVAAVPLVDGHLPRGRNLLLSALTGLLMVAVFFYGLTEGTVQAGGGNTSVLANISPFFVVILGRLLLNERITPLRVSGLVIGFGGVVMMVWTQLGGAHARNLPVGLALGVAAALAWGVGTLLVKGSVARGQLVDFVGFTAGQYTFGGIVLLVIAFAVDGTHGTDWGSLAMWGPLAYLIVGSAVGSLAYFAALKRLSATATTATLFLIPVVAVVVEIARGNAPTALVAAGMALAIAGVLLVNLPPLRIRQTVTVPRGGGSPSEPVA